MSAAEQTFLKGPPLVLVLAGWLLVTVLIALNRGIELLWGMAALLAAALAIALLLPALQLRRLQITRELPAEGIAGQPLELGYRVTVNGPGACYGIEVHDSLDEVPGLVPAAFLARVAGSGTQRCEWTPPVRGRREFGALLLESGYPLGLLRARRVVEAAPQSMTIYPDLVALQRLPPLPGGDPSEEHFSAALRGGRDEFFAMRPYRPGDDPRAVHWRATARAGELLVREYLRPQNRQLWIVLDLAAHAHTGSGRDSTHEYMFRIAHSVIARAQLEGIAPGLLLRPRGQAQLIEPGLDQLSYLRLRECLALAELDDGPPPESWIAAERQLPGGSWLVFNLGGPGRRGVLAAACRRHGAAPLLIEFQHDSFGRPLPDYLPRIAAHGGADSPAWTVPLGADLRQLFT